MILELLAHWGLSTSLWTYFLDENIRSGWGGVGPGSWYRQTAGSGFDRSGSKAMHTLDTMWTCFPSQPGSTLGLITGPWECDPPLLGPIAPLCFISFRSTDSLPSKNLKSTYGVPILYRLRLLMEPPIYASSKSHKGGIIILPILEMGKQGSERGSDLPRITQLRYRTEI